MSDMVKDSYTLYTRCTNSSLLDFGFRTVKVGRFPLARVQSACCSGVESVSSNDVPCVKRWGKMARRNNQERNYKVSWIRENEAQFIVLCHQEYLNGQLLTTNFSRAVYRQICDKLNDLVVDRCFYNIDQLKMKYKNIKKAWRLLHGLRHKHGSGLGWDPQRETVVGSDDVLESIYAESRENKAIIKRGLPHFDLCTKMFDNKVAIGHHARSSTQDPSDGDDGDLPPPPSLHPYDNSNPSGSHFVYNFTPDFTTQDVVGSSRSSGRKRSNGASERDPVIVHAMINFDAYISEKRAKNGESIDELAECIGFVRAMNGLSLRQQVTAGERLKGYATRQMFLQYNELERHEWMMSLPAP